MCNPEENIFYVYVYLDPRKPGHYVYGEYEFDYEPFYVGKGKNGRSHQHLCEGCQKRNGNTFFIHKIKKIQRVTGNDPIILIQKDGLIEQCSHDLEVDMVSTIGRYDLKKGPLCNLTDAGEGVSNPNEETRKKLGKGKKGKSVSEETRRKLGKASKGRIPNEETRKKMSLSHMGNKSNTGRKLTEEHKHNISKGEKGRIIPDEVKRRISETLKGHSVSEETRKKISEAKKRFRELVITS